MVFKDYGADGQNDVFFSGAPPARPENFDIFGPKITDFPLRNSHFSENFRAPPARDIPFTRLRRVLMLGKIVNKFVLGRQEIHHC